MPDMNMAERSYPTTMGKRYELVELLGSGGMGEVYRAIDFISGRQLALKRVTVPTRQLVFATRSENSNLDLAIAQEFRALATLRHPNVISVYDFGFDSQSRPYFTMEYIDSGLPIVDASRDLPFEKRVDLILQMLQAMAYLHRQGILHRDLKPANALVKNGRLKLLDFGLSVSTSHTMGHVTQTTVGTLAYLAPEIFGGAPYSRASDLYAVGMIAIELLLGQFPYNDTNMATLLNDILNKEIDTATYFAGEDLNLVLSKMVAKDPERRYASSAQLISDICKASKIPYPVETEELRDSYLQSARFVGRKAEIAYLTSLLKEAVKGNGSTLLIGGESGVGKSRLVDEIRILALVEGVLVLDGQAVSEGRNPYQTWLNAFSNLALQGNLDDREAAIFRHLVPNIEQLLNRQVAATSPMTPTESQRVLSHAVASVIGQLGRPVLIILEDIHWAGSESIQLLKDLTQSVPKLPCLLIGTYRTGEVPGAFNELTTASHLTLGRLEEAEIAALGSSMLGLVGKDAAIVQFLSRESEGNAFFLIEAVRTLAEEAGQLADINTVDLPTGIMSGGIQSILERRIDRLPKDARLLMKLASVAGRILDLSLLQILDSEVDLEEWLTVCTNAAVLEPYGDTWRFSHDKLREVIRDNLTHEEHHRLHHRIAVGLEQLYPDTPEVAAFMAHHWRVAGNKKKELHYAEMAADYAAETNASREAIRHYKRALELLADFPENEERDRRELDLLMGLGPPLMAIQGYAAPEVGRLYEKAKELASLFSELEIYFRATWGLWTYYNHKFDRGAEGRLFDELFILAEESGDSGMMLEAHHSGWSTALSHGDAVEVENNVSKGLEIYETDQFRDHIYIFGHDPGVCAHFVGSINLWLLGYPDKAQNRVLKGLKLAEELTHPLSTAIIKWGNVVVSNLRGEVQHAVDLAEELIIHSQSNGFLLFEIVARTFKESVDAIEGRSQKGFPELGGTLRTALSSGGFILWPWILSLYLEACRTNGAVEDGLRAISIELAEHEITGERLFESEVRRLYGELLQTKDEEHILETEKQLFLAIDIAQSHRAKSLELRAVMSLARLWSVNGKRNKALGLLADCYNWFTEGFETADLQNAKTLLEELRS